MLSISSQSAVPEDQTRRISVQRGGSVVKLGWVLPVNAQTEGTGTLAEFLRAIGVEVSEVDLDESEEEDDDAERDGETLIDHEAEEASDIVGRRVKLQGDGDHRCVIHPDAAEAAAALKPMCLSLFRTLNIKALSALCRPGSRTPMLPCVGDIYRARAGRRARSRWKPPPGRAPRRGRLGPSLHGPARSLPSISNSSHLPVNPMARTD